MISTSLPVVFVRRVKKEGAPFFEFALHRGISIKYDHATHDGILTLIESGYSVFLLKIPLFQGVYGTSNDF